MKPLIILGTGGNCLDILEAVLAINEEHGCAHYDCLGFLDDNPELVGSHRHGLPILGKLSEACLFRGALFVNGIGSPANYWCKPEILQRIGIALGRFATIIHPRACVSRFAEVGFGSVLLAGVCVGARARIGAHVIVLQGAIISHDCRVSDFSCIASGACLAGGVVLEEAAYVGANASVRGGVRLGAASLTGLGTVVISDVAPRQVVVGNPARILRELRP